METTRKDRRRAARLARAEETRRRALSPVRILLQIAAIPLVAAAVAVPLYLRTSDYPPMDAIRHLAALAGCEQAAAVGLAPAREGGLGYHRRNDPDGDGVACGTAHAAASAPARPADPEAPSRMTGGAKFLRP
ncbi:excalibur calcium-binding domain-containing protein [Psychromarinibacter sp. C21-152]|uniref:Excalibur calcium-binding domain-containing protein n=1 Tax=Psychromarinibacter sediminicola TaxID=3033385 RepID=A0AAE3TB06_9RHOB|nr:excalibur calcium-binding domain-containing protein [Psychromarinibacter sediminicola]MDF0603802.1 excalibur calcium-binding domain-containing protein [Psychromarinibacter sediminicola]